MVVSREKAAVQWMNTVFVDVCDKVAPGMMLCSSPPTPGPVKISHKKDGCRRRTPRFHVSQPPSPHLAAGSATGFEF